jgi:hypothetical protein
MPIELPGTQFFSGRKSFSEGMILREDLTFNFSSQALVNAQ